MAEAVTGLAECKSALDRIVSEVTSATPRGVADGGKLVADAIRSGAPRASGALASSVQADVSGDSATISMAIYGRRRDRGFHGTDARGHTYNDQGKHFVKAAVGPVKPRLSELFRRLWGDAIARH